MAWALRASPAAGPRRALARRTHHTAARRSRHALIPRARRPAPVRREPGGVQDFFHGTALLARVRAYRGHVGRRHLFDVAAGIPDGMDHREARTRTGPFDAIHPMSDSLLGERNRPHPRLDDPAARVGSAAVL